MNRTNASDMIRAKRFKAIVIGGSAGGFDGLAAIFRLLPSNFPLPVLVVQHLHSSDCGEFAQHLARVTRLQVVEPCDKERIEAGYVYSAPANYHLLLETNGTISLSVDEKVNWSRPSIDVLFESAARVFGESVVAVILSGASADGSKGMLEIKTAGGMTIAQDPTETDHSLMPRSAIDTGAVDLVLRAEDIGRLLVEIGARTGEDGGINI
ncbi:MAG: chemotaxis protein CheB [Thermodesulfobacteriota bacterium]